MKILSIYPWTHISSSALMIDGKLICASPEERFNRKKWSVDFPILSANWCLKQSKLDWKDLDIPICLRYNETYDQDWTKKEIEQSNASLVIFHHEKDLFGNLEDYRKMLPNVVFEYVPHSAEKTIFKVYEEVDKQYDLSLIHI